MRKFYVGQRPTGSVLFKIVDERKQPIEVMRYLTARVFIRRPDGSIYSEGSAIPVNSRYNAIEYEFGESSPFVVAGEYQIQIRLSMDRGDGTGPFDYTDIIAIDVIESLEGS